MNRESLVYPRVISGAIVGIDPTDPKPLVIIFQYNPDLLSRTLQPQMGAEGGGSSRSPSSGGGRSSTERAPASGNSTVGRARAGQATQRGHVVPAQAALEKSAVDRLDHAGAERLGPRSPQRLQRGQAERGQDAVGRGQAEGHPLDVLMAQDGHQRGIFGLVDEQAGPVRPALAAGCRRPPGKKGRAELVLGGQHDQVRWAGERLPPRQRCAGHHLHEHVDAERGPRRVDGSMPSRSQRAGSGATSRMSNRSCPGGPATCTACSARRAMRADQAESGARREAPPPPPAPRPRGRSRARSRSACRRGRGRRPGRRSRRRGPPPAPLPALWPAAHGRRPGRWRASDGGRRSARRVRPVPTLRRDRPAAPTPTRHDLAQPRGERASRRLDCLDRPGITSRQLHERGEVFGRCGQPGGAERLDPLG